MQRRGAPAPCRAGRKHEGKDSIRDAPRGADQLILRPYAKNDLAGLLTCWEAAIRLAEPRLSETFIAAERGNIRDAYLPKVETMVADLGGVAGFISLLGQEVAALFVHPDHQGKGVGSALLRAYPTPLTLEVFEANLKARAFYHRRGFRQTGERWHEESGHQLFCLALDERP